MKCYCILADDVSISENEYADIAAYFEGDFNEERVIFPFETEEDTHSEMIELVREQLREHTIYGITAATLKKAFEQKIVPHHDICKLTHAEAKIIYRKNYWDKYSFGELAWPVCMCCLDCAINHGGFAKILQRAANDCGNSLIVDGIYGPKTFAALKNSNPQELATAIVKYRKRYYESLVAKNPKQKVHLKGWLNRLRDMAKTAGVE